MKYEIEIEITPGNWQKVEASSLTDDHEQNPPADADPEMMDGSAWYLDGDYTVPPRNIRVFRKCFCGKQMVLESGYWVCPEYETDSPDADEHCQPV